MFGGSQTGSRPVSYSTLLARARRGDTEAFAHLISPYATGIGRRALRLTGNPADAEDASQEAIMKVWRRIEQFTGVQEEPGDDFRAWVTRIASNSAIDLLRQRRDGKVLSLEDSKGNGEETVGSSLPARSENPEQRFERRERCRLLARAICRLPRDLRRVCLLRDVLHYSTQDVAEHLGISLVAVRLRLFRAHRELGRNLEATLAYRDQPATKWRHSVRRPAVASQTSAGGGAAQNLRGLKIGYACAD